jgi:flavin reductase (DIM6/NTAB) family NADH-FMN oxidoreductase RutF
LPQAHKQQDLFLKATKQIACPVVCLAVKDEEDQVRAMISTVHYAQLTPLVLGTSLNKTSTTGSVIIARRFFSVNLMEQAHMPLLQAGKLPREFPWKNWSPYQLPGLEQALVKFACELLSQTPLDDYTAILARVLAVEINQAIDGQDSTLNPIIRYNRNYCNLNFSPTLNNLDQYPV